MLILIMKNITKNTMYIVQELHIFYNDLKLNYKCLLEVIFFSSIFSIHSSNNLSTNFFLHLQFL